jgi:hypothetical protein
VAPFFVIIIATTFKSDLHGLSECQILYGTELALFSSASAASTLGYKSANSQHLSFQYADTKANNKFRAYWSHQLPIEVAEIRR